MTRKALFSFSALFLLLYSCRQADRAIPVSSPVFDSLMRKTEQIYDSGDKAKAFAFIIYAHATTHALTVVDHMNYYTYCGELCRRDRNDYNKYSIYADSIIYVLEANNQGKTFPERYSQAYNMKGDAFFGKGSYNEAYNYYYQAKKWAAEHGDSCSLSRFSYSLGMALYKQQRYIKSTVHFRDAFNEASACEDNFVYFYFKQEVLDNIGLCYYKSQKYDSAMLFYRKALDYISANYVRYPEKEKTCKSAQAVVYGNLADLYTARRNYDTAKQLLRTSISINIQKGFTNNDALLNQVKLANVYYNTGQTAEMKDLLDRIRVEMDTIPDRQAALSWNRLMWSYYNDRSDSVSAYRYLLAYQGLNDSLLATNRLLVASDADVRIKTMERQYQINLLNDKNRYERIFIYVLGLFVVMALVIVFLVLKNAKKSRKNVRELVRLNARIQEQKEKLEYSVIELNKKERDKSRILRSVAHDVMNPISSIIALTDILISESATSTDEHMEILNLIKEACANSLNLSKDILEAALDIDEAIMAREWVDIRKLVGSSVELLSYRANIKNQHIVFNYTDEQIQAYINKEKMWRVINNLIGNAIKFSYEGSNIALNLSLVSGNVHLSVRDFGVGIPEKNLPHIFDMFTEAKNTGTSGEIPHGLGLSISLQIAKAHGGNIRVESKEGQGSTFFLEFPTKARL